LEHKSLGGAKVNLKLAQKAYFYLFIQTFVLGQVTVDNSQQLTIITYLNELKQW